MSKFRAYLQLMRFSAVFTALADICLGYLLTHREIEDPFRFAMLLVTSGCLYLAGMVFNDVFDQKIDAVERPGRPLPSGRISHFAALRLGILLLCGGIAAANLAGTQSLIVAALLIVAIFAYDGLLKQTFAGPVVMGSCRFLNVILGASANDALFRLQPSIILPAFSMPQRFVALALAVYVAGITLFARNEAGAPRKGSLIGASAVINLGLAGLVVFVVGLPGLLRPHPGEAAPLRAVLILGLIAASINYRLFAVIRQPEPRSVQTAVKSMLLSLIILDATLVFVHTGNEQYALAIAALVVPATLLGRWIFMT